MILLFAPNGILLVATFSSFSSLLGIYLDTPDTDDSGGWYLRVSTPYVVESVLFTFSISYKLKPSGIGSGVGPGGFNPPGKNMSASVTPTTIKIAMVAKLIVLQSCFFLAFYDAEIIVELYLDLLIP